MIDGSVADTPRLSGNNSYVGCAAFSRNDEKLRKDTQRAKPTSEIAEKNVPTVTACRYLSKKSLPHAPGSGLEMNHGAGGKSLPRRYLCIAPGAGVSSAT